MFENVNGIKLSGAIFTEQTVLNLFDPDNKKGTLLYGRNGSGKSTVARAFNKIAGKDQSAISAILIDKEGLDITLTEDGENHIFVFNEEFVDKNVKLKDDSLDTIVMLGEEVDLAEKIEKAEKDLEKAEEDLEKAEKEYKEYDDYDKIISPQYHLDRITKKLQGDDHWAGLNRRIDNSRQNTSVNKKTIESIIASKPQDTREKLLSDFYKKMEQLEKNKRGDSIIKDGVPLFLLENYLNYNDNEIQTLLAEKIEKPELSEREKKILSMVHENQMGELNKHLDYLKKDDTKECPYCFQSLTQDYKEKLVFSIEKVLSKKVIEHQNTLRKHIFEVLSIKLDAYCDLLGCQHYIDLINEINRNIASNNDAINKKIKNPYEIITVDNKHINASLHELKQDLKILEFERINYNEIIKKIEPIQNELKQINSAIAYYDIVEDYNQYQNQQKKKEEAENRCKECNEIKKQKKRDLADLNARRKNIKEVYRYATNPNTNEREELMIGNMMRQVLEAFSTFEYKLGINDVTRDKELQNKLGDERYVNYFGNLMYRLVLHGGSHREEQVKAMHDLHFFELTSHEEKVRTAKDILCFLFLLNQEHVLKHLGNIDGKITKENVLSTLKEWCKNIL